MKTGECVRYVNVEIEELECLTISKLGACLYELVFEGTDKFVRRQINSSAEIRKIIHTAEEAGYRSV